MIGNPKLLTFDTSLPLFTYGLLKPGELAFNQISPFIESSLRDQVMGTLMMRDGLAVFFESPEKGSSYKFKQEPVSGWLYDFGHNADEAYEKISQFEPYKLYNSSKTVTVQGHKVNILIGKKQTKGRPQPCEIEWEGVDDPMLQFALPQIHRACQKFQDFEFSSHPEGLNSEEWRQYFELQKEYLLLWSVIERITALKFGPQVGPAQRNGRCLGEDPDWQKAFSLHMPDNLDLHITKTDDLGVTSTLNKSQPIKAATFFYDVRSNLVHRGKSGWKDARILKISFEILCQIIVSMIGIWIDERCKMEKQGLISRSGKDWFDNNFT